MSVTKTDKEVTFIKTTSADYAAQTEIISDAIYFLTDTKEIYVGSTKYSQSVNLKNGTGTNSIMMLSAADASDSYAFAEGNNTAASAPSSHAEGNSTKASGSNSHAEGNSTKASGSNSHAEGYSTYAYGNASHAEGQSTIASDSYSHAEGNSTTASCPASHAQGKFNVEDSSRIYADIIGNGTDRNHRSNAATVDWSGNAWYAGDVYVGSTSGTNKDEGSKKLATEEYVYSELNKHATNAFSKISVDGTEINASSTSSTFTINSGNNIEIEPSSTSITISSSAVSSKMDKENPTGTGSFSLNRKADTTIGDYSFAEGNGTTASGNSSHAEGYGTTALGPSSHAEGYSTQAGLKIFSVISFNQDSFTLSSVEGLAVGMYYSLITSGNIYSKYGSIMAIDANANTITVDAFPEDAQSANYIFIEADKTLGDTVVGDYSHAEGYGTTALGSSSHAEGSHTTASGGDSHAEGNSTTASGPYSHAEGRETIASGNRSHAEGSSTTASGDYSHAEGYKTTASGEGSHTEGNYTEASGESSHAEGFNTKASGIRSHAEGFNTKASGECSHVQGKYNVEDTTGEYSHIVGNGKSPSIRSNAHTLDWSGNAWYARDVYVGSTSGTNKDEGSRKLISVAPNAGAHNAIYRGDSLGHSVTAEQWTAIKTGTFENMYIGDYWTIGGVVYRIAAFNYYYNTGDKACTNNHITIVPEANMYDYVMNDTNTTTGAYVSSKMYTTGLKQAKTNINNAFGKAHILNHRQYLHNAVTDGYPSAGSWYDSTVELMTEQNVYGGKIYGSVMNGTAVPRLFTIDKSQYPLFAFRPDMQHTASWFWLRDVVSGTAFAVVNDYGNAHYSRADATRGVRPAFSIYQS